MPDYHCPPEIVEILKRYVEHGVPVGDFLTAVLSNDLREAFGRADIHDRYALFDIVCYCWNKIPSDCWGSSEKVNNWIARHLQAAQLPKLRASFSYIPHPTTPDRVFISDDCNESGTMSVTNDAEAVVAHVNADHPGKRIIYKDTDGRWDELVHKSGVFETFKPYKEELP